MTDIRDFPPDFTEEFTVFGKRGAAYDFLNHLDFSVEIGVTKAGEATLVLGLKRRNTKPCYVAFEDLRLVENTYGNSDSIFATLKGGGSYERTD